MTTDFQKLKTTWEDLGKNDPLWAVLSHDDKRGSKWNPDDFFKTGETDIARYHSLLKKYGGCPDNFDHVLDFGCGVGRLCLAWSRRSKQVTGVDISQPMLEHAAKLLNDVKNTRFQLNQSENLNCFPSAHFDVIASHICLQHIPWPVASNYITEFGRICRPSGHVIFQLPTRGGKMAQIIRKRIVDSLPFGLSKRYRQWRRGVATAFEMHYTPAATVIRVAEQAGLKLLHQEPDDASGESTEGFLYLFQRRSK